MDFRSNIIYSLQNNLSQLRNIKSKLSNQFYEFNNEISNLPEKEKILRAIERNQKIKESLYLFSSSKREEAEVSFAVTEPSIKVVEYAITNYDLCVSKSNIIYVGAIFISFLFFYFFIHRCFFSTIKYLHENNLKNLNFFYQ